MTKNALKKVLEKLKNSLDKKQDIQRCIVHPTGGTSASPAGWCKFAETNITSSTTDVEIVFDVFDGYGIHQAGSAYGRLLFHIRVLNGQVYEPGTVVQWLYNNKMIDFNDFVLFYKTENGSHNVQLWTNVTPFYIHRFFNVVSSKSFSDWDNNWDLFEVTGNNTGIPPEDYNSIVSKPGWQQAQINRIAPDFDLFPYIARIGTGTSGQCAFVFTSKNSQSIIRSSMHFTGIGNTAEYFEMTIFYNNRYTPNSSIFPAVVNTQCMHGDVSYTLLKLGSNSFAVVFKMEPYSVITCISSVVNGAGDNSAYCTNDVNEIPTGEEVQLTEIGVIKTTSSTFEMKEPSFVFNTPDSMISSDYVDTNRDNDNASDEI